MSFDTAFQKPSAAREPAGFFRKTTRTNSVRLPKRSANCTSLLREPNTVDKLSRRMFPLAYALFLSIYFSVYFFADVWDLSFHLLKCPYHQNSNFPIWSYISCNEHLRKKIFDLDKKQFCYECLRTWKSYFLAVDPCRWSQHRHAQSCDVDSGTCDFRLELSRLFYLCKFSFVVHAKCSSPACCMNYKVKFTEVKQARKVKPEVTCSLIYVTTHSKRREGWCEWSTKMAANLNDLKLLKKIAFYPNQIFLSQKFIWWDIESDKKIKILTIWSL